MRGRQQAPREPLSAWRRLSCRRRCAVSLQAAPGDALALSLPPLRCFLFFLSDTCHKNPLAGPPRRRGSSGHGARARPQKAGVTPLTCRRSCRPCMFLNEAQVPRDGDGEGPQEGPWSGPALGSPQARAHPSLPASRLLRVHRGVGGHPPWLQNGSLTPARPCRRQGTHHHPCDLTRLDSKEPGALALLSRSEAPRPLPFPETVKPRRVGGAASLRSELRASLDRHGDHGPASEGLGPCLPALGRGRASLEDPSSLRSWGPATLYGQWP